MAPWWTVLFLTGVSLVAARLNESCTEYSQPLGRYEGLRCSNGRCIVEWFVCDGDDDCRDGSDEEGCDIDGALMMMSGTCHAPMSGYGHGVRCRSGECVQRRVLCDGTKDCQDGTDEECRPHGYNSTAPGRMCTSSLGAGRTCGMLGRCLPLQWFCDGEPDCHGGEDEEGCSGPACRTILGVGMRCAGKCVPRVFFCDGDDDCPDGTDEQNCPAAGRRLGFTEYEAVESTTLEETTTPRPTTPPTRPTKRKVSHSRIQDQFDARGHPAYAASASAVTVMPLTLPLLLVPWV